MSDPFTGPVGAVLRDNEKKPFLQVGSAGTVALIENRGNGHVQIEDESGNHIAGPITTGKAMVLHKGGVGSLCLRETWGDFTAVNYQVVGSADSSVPNVRPLGPPVGVVLQANSDFEFLRFESPRAVVQIENRGDGRVEIRNTGGTAISPQIKAGDSLTFQIDGGGRYFLAEPIGDKTAVVFQVLTFS